MTDGKTCREHHVAQLNIAKMKAPLDDPLMADFVDALDPVNKLADESPGFVWRLQSDDGAATSYRPFADDTILVNLSVWESVESLQAFFTSGLHAAVMRRRREWFEKMVEAYAVLWWVPAGHIPTVEESKKKLQLLREYGPTQEAFSFGQFYPRPI